MIEESLESFVLQYKPFAIEADLLGKTEGSPLVECVVSKKVVHFMDRTGPYSSTPGKHKVILNSLVERLSVAEFKQKMFESPSLSKLKATGIVLEHYGENLVVDVGITLIVSSYDGFPEVSLGDWVSFESIAPLHGFLVIKAHESKNYRRPEDEL